MDYGEKSWKEGLLEAFIKGIAEVIALFIFIGIWSMFEFGWNPSNHYSVFIEGNGAYAISGVHCGEEKVKWYFQIEDQWIGSKANYARLLVWQEESKDSVPTHISEIEIKDRGNFTLESCPNETVDVAFVWSIDSGKPYIHLRVREYEFSSSPQTTVPKGAQQ